MKNNQKSLFLLLFVAIGLQLQAKEVVGKKKRTSNFIAACAPAQAQIDMDINNVRARLLTGGDLWWNRDDGKYVVPKPLPGQPEVTAIYAAGIWLGGFDAGGNLKMACQTYGSGGDNDYWPGPLSEDEGITDPQTCNDWDRHFEIKGTDIQQHLSKYQQAQDGQQQYLESEIPLSVKGWPARGNPYFTQVHGFNLPNTDQGLADFYDQDGDGNYEPLEGDFPTLAMRGCNYEPMFPDQMVFWIYNDEGAGAIHEETHGIPIRMEIQATAFAFSTFDPLNDMTFQRHKFINRAKEDIDSTYFGLWADVDLGCAFDDNIGCDISRGLAYYYNRDQEDGSPGVLCNGFPTYGTHIPALGIDFFRGPLDENGNELGMSNFMYYNFLGPNDPPPGTIDPANDVEFYRYLTASWKDGTPLTYGGDGYDPTVANDVIKFAFPNPPNEPNSWSMCYPGPEFPNGLPIYLRNTIQSSGPFRLQPGAVNELVFGVVFAPNIDYPCPDLSRLFAADDYAQAIFDNCEAFLYGPDGPDAPDVDWVAGDRQVTGILTNPIWSNNAHEDFESPVFGHPKWATDGTYNFEGYLVFQTAGNEFQLADIYDTTKTRLVFQSDLDNEFSTVLNWKAIRNPNYQKVPGSEQFLYLPNESIVGGNAGLQHEFTLTEDLFAKGDDRRLVNHRNYYYVALAYAANNFEPFNPSNGMGQKKMYIVGRRNIGPDGVGPYEVLPRPAQSGLDKVQIVPNPFYNATAYADPDGNGVVKITNLPAQCEVMIFSLDGKLVRKFRRNEVPAPPIGSGVTEGQIYPDLIWDLKNEHGKTIGAGVYLVRIRAEGLGEVTLKAVVI